MPVTDPIVLGSLLVDANKNKSVIPAAVKAAAMGLPVAPDDTPVAPPDEVIKASAVFNPTPNQPTPAPPDIVRSMLLAPSSPSEEKDSMAELNALSPKPALAPQPTPPAPPKPGFWRRFGTGVEKAMPYVAAVGAGLEAGAGRPGDARDVSESAYRRGELGLQRERLRTVDATMAAAHAKYFENMGSQYDLVTPQIGTDSNGNPIYGPPIARRDAGRYQTQGLKNEGNLEVQGAKNQGNLAVAHVRADDQMALAEFKMLLDQGKVASVHPIVDNGEARLGAYNSRGDLIRTLDKSVGAAWMLPTTRSGLQVHIDANGNLQYVPVSTTTVRQLPAGGGTSTVPPQVPITRVQPQGTPQATPLSPEFEAFQAVNSFLSGMSPQPAASQSPQAPAAAPANSAPAPAPPRGKNGARGVRPVGQARPVMGANGQPFATPKAVEPGYGFDPTTNQWYLTSRGESAGKGYQNFLPATQQAINKDRIAINQFGDIERRADAYDAALQDPNFTDDDRATIGKIIRSDKFKLGMFGLSVPVDQINIWMRSNRLGQLSPAGAKALAAYYNVRESIPQFQKAATGSARSSDVQLELALQALPIPTDPPAFAKENSAQFNQQIQVAKRGLPIIPGVNAPAANQSSGGLKVGATATHADGSKWRYNGGADASDIKNWTMTAPPTKK